MPLRIFNSIHLVAFMVFRACLVFAPTFAGSEELKAEKVLSESVKFLQSSPTISIKFKTKTYWQAMEEWQSSEGKLWTEKGSRFHLFLPGSELVSDGKTFWQYSSENNQVLIENVSSTGMQKTPGDILLQFMNCSPLNIKKIQEKQKEYYKIQLLPTRQLNHYDSIYIYIDDKKLPARVHTVDNGGNETLYELVEIKKGVEFKKKDFVFVPPKGVEVIDMREGTDTR